MRCRFATSTKWRTATSSWTTRCSRTTIHRGSSCATLASPRGAARARWRRGAGACGLPLQPAREATRRDATHGSACAFSCSSIERARWQMCACGRAMERWRSVPPLPSAAAGWAHLPTWTQCASGRQSTWAPSSSPAGRSCRGRCRRARVGGRGPGPPADLEGMRRGAGGLGSPWLPGRSRGPPPAGPSLRSWPPPPPLPPPPAAASRLQERLRRQEGGRVGVWRAAVRHADGQLPV